MDGPGQCIQYHCPRWGIPGFVIMFDRLRDISVDGYVIEAEAGAKLIDTTLVALHHSLKGFEFASGIPGSVGGAVFMNAGAYGERSHVLVSCKVLTKDGEIETLSASELAFGYRHSKIQETGAVVISAKFALSPNVTSKSNRRWIGWPIFVSWNNPLNTLLVDRSLSVLLVILQVNWSVKQVWKAIESVVWVSEKACRLYGQCR